MNQFKHRLSGVLLIAILAGTCSVTAFAGSKSKACRQCGCEEHVKQVCRLVKTSRDVEIPSYVYTKEEVFYPDKGAICYTQFRSDTFYDFWRSRDEAKGAVAQHNMPQLHCNSYTVCGCKTLYGAKSTGCHAGCSVRVPGKSRQVTSPILKWETVPLCKDCRQK